MQMQFISSTECYCMLYIITRFTYIILKIPGILPNSSFYPIAAQIAQVAAALAAATQQSSTQGASKASSSSTFPTPQLIIQRPRVTPQAVIGSTPTPSDSPSRRGTSNIFAWQVAKE